VSQPSNPWPLFWLPRIASNLTESEFFPISNFISFTQIISNQ
jgi:hypothetical protein